MELAHAQILFCLSSPKVSGVNSVPVTGVLLQSHKRLVQKIIRVQKKSAWLASQRSSSTEDELIED